MSEREGDSDSRTVSAFFLGFLLGLLVGLGGVGTYFVMVQRRSAEEALAAREAEMQRERAAQALRAAEEEKR
jgi:hypothetical protein